MTNLNQQRIERLKAQLNMALSSNPPSKMQILLLKAEIRKMEDVKNESRPKTA